MLTLDSCPISSRASSEPIFGLCPERQKGPERLSTLHDGFGI